MNAVAYRQNRGADKTSVLWQKHRYAIEGDQHKRGVNDVEMDGLGETTP